MTTVVLLAILLGAAFAAPAEPQAPEAAVGALNEAVTAAPALVNDEAGTPESRFNFCPDGWFSHGSRCFMFVDTPKTWYSAEEHCNGLGAHLASATNSREYGFLQQLTQTGGMSISWLGGFNLQTHWMWIDREGFYYTNWYSASSSSSYPCIFLRTTNGWGNTACSSSYRFICSKNPFAC